MIFYCLELEHFRRLIVMSFKSLTFCGGTFWWCILLYFIFLSRNWILFHHVIIDDHCDHGHGTFFFLIKETVYLNMKSCLVANLCDFPFFCGSLVKKNNNKWCTDSSFPWLVIFEIMWMEHRALKFQERTQKYY